MSYNNNWQLANTDQPTATFLQFHLWIVGLLVITELRVESPEPELGCVAWTQMLDFNRTQQTFVVKL